jgi:hypothetical protein
MNSQEAQSVVTGIKELFPGMAQAEWELLQRGLEKYPLNTTQAVVDEYAQAETVYDRAKFFKRIRERHDRLAPWESPTPAWKAQKEAEKKSIDDSLNGLPKERLDAISADAREKWPDVFQYLKLDP